MNQFKKTEAAPKKAASFNPKNLSEKQQEDVVAEYIGIHPKYFWYKGRSIDIDQYKMSKDGMEWTGFDSSRNLGK